MTRKEGKGYLRSDFLGQAGPNSTHPLELVRAAERTERITVGDDTRGQGRSNPSECLDFSCRGDVYINDCWDDRLVRDCRRGGSSGCCRLRRIDPSAFAFFSAFLLAREVLACRVDGGYLGVESASRGGVRRSVAAKDRCAACARTQDDNGAEEEERLSLARSRHQSS
jgi:hypothetical protein